MKKTLQQIKIRKLTVNTSNFFYPFASSSSSFSSSCPFWPSGGWQYVLGVREPNTNINAGMMVDAGNML